MSEVVRVRRDMGCTRAEFMGWLAGATRGAPLRINGSGATVSLPGGSVQITLDEKPPRTIGALSLPVLGTTFAFDGLDPAAREDFLRFFDLYTRRGGG